MISTHILAAALFHSFWQAALIAALVYVALSVIKDERAALRYRVAVLGLYAVPLVFAGTLYVLATRLPTYDPQMTFGVGQTGIDVLVYAWLLGAIFMLTRLGRGAYGVSRLARQNIEQPGAEFSKTFTHLREKLGLPDRIRFGLSRFVSSPCTFGFWRPVLLLPVSCFTRLDPLEVEAIIAHELAHIKRHDFLHHVLQIAIEAFFYFNPGVRYLTRQVSLEREHACDDIAVALIGASKPLATGLLKVGLTRALGDCNREGDIALAAANQGAIQLKTRISRLVNIKTGKPGPIKRVSLGAVLALGVIVASGTAFNKVAPFPQTTDPFTQSTYLLSLKDDVCDILYEDNIYYMRTYYDGTMADLTFANNTVFMGGEALPKATQSSIRKVFKKHGVKSNQTAHLQFHHEKVRLIRETNTRDTLKNVQSYTITPDQKRVILDHKQVHHTGTSYISRYTAP